MLVDHVALVGMPGIGKSTIGRDLAFRLKYSFNDVDHWLEERFQCSISEYFLIHGEQAFRRQESEAIDLLSRKSYAVIATGGGAVLDGTNRSMLSDRCFVIYLHATPQELLPRVQQDASRPLLQVDDPLAKLQELYAARHPLYQQTAHLVIDQNGLRVQASVDAVLANCQQMDVSFSTRPLQA